MGEFKNASFSKQVKKEVTYRSADSSEECANESTNYNEVKKPPTKTSFISSALNPSGDDGFKGFCVGGNTMKEMKISAKNQARIANLFADSDFEDQEEESKEKFKEPESSKVSDFIKPKRGSITDKLDQFE